MHLNFELGPPDCYIEYRLDSLIKVLVCFRHMICKRCSFECDMGKYSTRTVNRV